MNKNIFPLDRVLVIDFTQAFSGPFCTMNLADQGARVIKIERPGTGDMLRKAGPFDGNHRSMYFASGNRGKKSVALDLSSKKDKKLIFSMIKKADIIVENFRPGVMDKLGYGYEDVKKVTPEIIYASISGFGHTGSKKMEPGFDMIAQGYSGLMSVCGDIGNDFQRVGISIGDIIGGMYCYMSIMTALYGREKTGKGTYIDVSMLDGLFSILSPEVASYMNTGQISKPSGNSHPNICPFGVVYTKDGKIIISVLGAKLWKKFCLAINMPELESHELYSTNELRLKNRVLFRKLIRPVFKTKYSKEWLDIFHKTGIPCGLVNDIKSACEMDQIKARNMICKAGEFMLAGNPMNLRTFSNPEEKGKVPELGEHTYSIKKEFN